MWTPVSTLAASACLAAEAAACTTERNSPPGTTALQVSPSSIAGMSKAASDGWAGMTQSCAPLCTFREVTFLPLPPAVSVTLPPEGRALT